MTTPATETANIHLEIDGREHLLPIQFQLGEQTIAGLLPFAQQLTNELTTLSIQKVESEGKKISCQMGCGACCRQLVAISLVEAQDLARVVGEMPSERQAVIRERFAKGIAKLEAAGLLDAAEKKGSRDLIDTEPGSTQSSIPRIAKKYFEQAVACPFLENESCGIYPDRPLVCREYHVTSPAERCAKIYQIGVDPVPVSRHVGEHLARTAHAVAGLPKQMIPLLLSLEWADAHPDAAREKHDGLDLVRALVSEISQ
jgi:Fe-S-cluster containining protein